MSNHKNVHILWSYSFNRKSSPYFVPVTLLSTRDSVANKKDSVSAFVYTEYHLFGKEVTYVKIISFIHSLGFSTLILAPSSLTGFSSFS